MRNYAKTQFIAYVFDVPLGLVMDFNGAIFVVVSDYVNCYIDSGSMFTEVNVNVNQVTTGLHYHHGGSRHDMMVEVRICSNLSERLLYIF